MYYPNKDKIFDQSVDLIFRQLADDWAGAFSEEATPVPIPNTEVKLLSADDSGNAKVGRCLDNILSFFVLKNFFL